MLSESDVDDALARVMDRISARTEIEATHSWLHRCFPPRPTTCMVCGATKSDPDLKPCLMVGLMEGSR